MEGLLDFLGSLERELTSTLTGNERPLDIVLPAVPDMASLHALSGHGGGGAVEIQKINFILPVLWISCGAYDRTTLHSPTMSIPCNRVRSKSGVVYPCKLAVTKSGNLVVSRDDLDISIVSVDGTVVRQFGLDALNVRYIAVDSTGLIWICYYQKKEIHCFTEHGRLVRVIQTAGEPEAIAFFSDDRLLVAEYVFSEGMQLVTYTTDYDQPPVQLTHLGIGGVTDLSVSVCHHTDEIYVLNRDTYICVYSREGVWRRDICCSDRIMSMALTNDGHVLTYFNKKMSLWTSQGVLVRQWPLEDVMPNGHMVVLPHGHIAVLCSVNQNVQHYRVYGGYLRIRVLVILKLYFH